MSPLLFPAFNNSNTATALHCKDGDWTYAALHQHINRTASALLGNSKDLAEERIAFFMPASADYVALLLGIWRAGGIAIPLNTSAALPELEHALLSAGVTRLVISGSTDAQVHLGLQALCDKLRVRVLQMEELVAQTAATADTVQLPILAPKRRAMILFTSGTTNKPKGVVSTHHNIATQITTLLQAWAWHSSDRIPLFLPLHHIHGIINVLCCALWQGAELTLFARFEMDSLLQQVEQQVLTQLCSE